MRKYGMKNLFVLLLVVAWLLRMYIPQKYDWRNGWLTNKAVREREERGSILYHMTKSEKKQNARGKIHLD